MLNEARVSGDECLGLGDFHHKKRPRPKDDDDCCECEEPHCMGCGHYIEKNRELQEGPKLLEFDD